MSAATSTQTTARTVPASDPRSGVNLQQHPGLADRSVGGADHGVYAVDGEPVGIPRRTDGTSASAVANAELHGHAPIAALTEIAARGPGSTSPRELMLAVVQSIPKDQVKALVATVNEAKVQAALGLAPEFPDQRRSEILAKAAAGWAHSRDVAVTSAGAGWPEDVTGKHDVTEDVPFEQAMPPLRALAALEGVPQTFRNYIAHLDEQRPEFVNVGFWTNPNLIVAGATVVPPGFPTTGAPGRGLEADNPNREAAAFFSLHVLASLHHALQPLDLIEAVINVAAHRREARGLGVLKADQVSIEQLNQQATGENGAAPNHFTSPAGAVIAQDVIAVIEHLEGAGFLTPWHVIDSNELSAEDYGAIAAEMERIAQS